MGLTMFGIAPVCLAGLLTAPSALALGPPVAPATGEQLYEEGEHAYFIGDFDTAVSKFEAAYRVSKLAAVLYNIALAYLRRYEVSSEPKDLRRAKAVLENFGLELARNPNLANAENVRALSAKIDEALAKHPTVVPVPSAPAEQAEQAEQATPRAALTHDTAPETPPSVPSWKGLTVGGGLLIGLSVGSAATAIVAAARGKTLEARFEQNMCSLYTPTSECESLISQGKRTNVVTVVTAIVAPLLLAGGVTMLTLGLKRRATRHVAPVVSPTFIGLTVHARF
jgi:hypothetical protein